MLVGVVILTFNEERTIEEIVRRVAAGPLHTEIIAVDDGPTDGTGAILARIKREIGHLRTLRARGSRRATGSGRCGPSWASASEGKARRSGDVDHQDRPVRRLAIAASQDAEHGLRAEPGMEPERQRDGEPAPRRVHELLEQPRVALQMA